MDWITSNGTSTNITASTNGFSNYFDYSIRILAVFVHLAYACFVFYLKEYKNNNLIFLNHVNLVSLLYCVHFLFYMVRRYPEFKNQDLNIILCTTSEIVWIVVKLMRIFSLALLTIYRYMAVYHMNYYKAINKKAKYLIISILISWIIAIVLSLILKYSFQTTYSIFLHRWLFIKYDRLSGILFSCCNYKCYSVIWYMDLYKKDYS